MKDSHSKSGQPEKRRALIITAISTEYKAVRAHLSNMHDVKHRLGNYYEQGEYQCGNVTWDVGLVEVGKGNTKSGIYTERAISFFEPEVILLAGVAGGIKDVRIGDVVIPTDVYGYEYGKAGEKFLARPKIGRPTFGIFELAKSVARKNGWLRRVAGDIESQHPNVLFEAPIAAGEKVVTSTGSQLYKFISEHYNDAIAVEMEGYGFFEAAFANPQVEALVIRGISDLIDDKEKTDGQGCQEKAARHAAAFAFEILCRYERLGRGVVLHAWNVPLNRNPRFTGREDILGQLRDALASGHRAALTQAVYGLGGMGKTQLALEYAYRHKDEYSCIWWVRSEKPEQIKADYAGLAHALDLPEKNAKKQALTIAAVRQWLQENEGWLLIFDNAPGPEEIRDYLPGDSPGHVIITSRNPNWRAVAGQPMEIPVMPPDEAVEFLLNRTGLSDRNAARKLADALDCLPLALEQAAAYIEEKVKSLDGYLALFKENRKILLRQQPGTEYKETVATTWAINFTEVREESAAGAELLNLCAFMAPDDIPMEIIRDGAEHLPPPLDSAVTDTVEFDGAVAVLWRYSLVNIRSDTLSVHRMVQAVVQDGLVERHKKKWASAAVEIVNEAFPFDSDDVRTWPACSRLLPHALASTDHAEALGVAPRATGHLLNQAGLYLQGRADFAQARSCFERALKILEKTHDKDHPNVAATVNNLGGVLHTIGDLEGAKAHFVRALEIDEKIYGPEHPAVARNVNNLGNVLRDMGDREGAKACLERALEILEKTLGKDHSNIAKTVNNLGGVLQDMGDMEGAKAHFERALEIGKKTLGGEHPDVATWTNNLGRVLHDMGDLENAKACFERTLKILEKTHDKDHPNVAATVNNLGGVLQDMGDLKGAKAHFERALRICMKFLGEDHPNTILVRENLESLDDAG